MAINPRENHETDSETRNVRRHTFEEDPATTQVLADRIPATSDEGLELSYRATRLSVERVTSYANRYVTWGVLFLPPLLFALIMLPLFLPLAEPIVFAVSLLAAILRALLFGKRDLRSFLKVAFLPLIAVLAGDLLRAIEATSFPVVWTAALIGAVAFLYVVFSNGGPIGFGWIWLMADPKFTGRESKDARKFGHSLGYAMQQHGGLQKPQTWLSAFFNVTTLLLFGWWLFVLVQKSSQLPDISPREAALRRSLGGNPMEPFFELAFLLALNVVLLLVIRFMVRRAGEPFGHFLTYGKAPTNAPGVFASPAPLAVRRRSLVALAVSALIASFTSNGFFLPEGLAGLDDFRVLTSEETRPATSTRAPAPALSEAPRIEHNQDLIAQALSNVERVSQQLGGAPETPTLRNSAPPRQVTALVSSGIDDLKDLSQAPNSELTRRASVFLWLLAMSVLMSTPILCLLLFPSLAYLLFYKWRLTPAEPSPARAFLGAEPADHHDQRTMWQKLVDRVRESSYEAPDPVTGAPVLEREHLFLGIEPNGNFPILWHQKLLREHVYIVGDSGSGKTSLGIMPILKQVMRAPQAVSEPPSPVVVLDLKGDSALFNMTREEAENRGQRFLYFTPEQGRFSHHFNPFEDFDRKNRTLSSFSTLFLDALSLNHGEGYGRGYFTARNRQLLYSVLEEHEPESFEELYRHLVNQKGTTKEEAFELIAVIQMLAGYKILSGTRGERQLPEDRIIQMRRLIEKNEVAYFWLPAAIESISVREIGKLALFCLVSAAIARQRDGMKTKTVYVVVDEFQRLAGENFSILLEQARSFGVSLILANQTLSDLNTPSKDLRPSIRTNTRTKFFFSVTEPEEIENLSSLSGREIVVNRSRSVAKARKGILPNTTDTESFVETISPRLSSQDIQRISDHPNEFLLHVSRGSGFTQFGGLPVPVRTEWPMSEREYERLQSIPWPKPPETTAEQLREGLTVEETPIKERERAAKAESERWFSTIAADVSGYIEIRRFDRAPEDGATN